MRLLYPLLFWLLPLVYGYAQAPGIYPADEVKENNDWVVPKNPYQGSWTGYEYYYEKDGAKKETSTIHSASEGGGNSKSKPKTGVLKPFKSIEQQESDGNSIFSDKEAGEDPNYTGLPDGSPSHLTNSESGLKTGNEITEVSPSTTKGINMDVDLYYETTTTASSTSSSAPSVALTTPSPKPSPTPSTIPTSIPTRTSPKVAPSPSTIEHPPTPLSPPLIPPTDPFSTGSDALSATDNDNNGVGYDFGNETPSTTATTVHTEGKKVTQSPTAPSTSTSPSHTSVGGEAEEAPSPSLSSSSSLSSSPYEGTVLKEHVEIFPAGQSSPSPSPSPSGIDFKTLHSILTLTQSSTEFEKSRKMAKRNEAFNGIFAEPKISNHHFQAPSPPLGSRISHAPLIFSTRTTRTTPTTTISTTPAPAPITFAPRLMIFHPSRYVKNFEDEYSSTEEGIDNISPIESRQGVQAQIGKHPTPSPSSPNHNDSSKWHSRSLGTSTLNPNYSNYSNPQQDLNDFVGGYPDKDTDEFNQQPRRESVDYGQQHVTGDFTKDVIVETNGQKYGRSSRKCCSCCENEKQPVNREIETIEPSGNNIQQVVDPTRITSEFEEPSEGEFSTVGMGQIGGSAYVQRPPPPPAVAPSRPIPIPRSEPYVSLPLAPQTYAQHPFQQYQPQYPQSYPYQNTGCACQQAPPQNCCPPPQPCCAPQLPCCPTIPCCPSRTICCQPQPICLPPPTCCQINFQLPTIPICGRACPSCPCRRRVHKARRLKRHSIGGSCNQCSQAGEPWKSVLHHSSSRQKRFATGGGGCGGGDGCGQCGASSLRSHRVKRMGCLPCLMGRKKREADESSHIRVKRMGCVPCLGRKKRSALGSLGSSNCSSCSNLGQLFGRYKRSLFGGCSPCRQKREACPCQSQSQSQNQVAQQSQLLRGKREANVKKNHKRMLTYGEVCDSSCCDYSRCQGKKRTKKETLVPFLM